MTKTRSYTKNLMNRIVDDIDEGGYYLFASNYDEEVYVDSSWEEFNFLGKTIFGKEVSVTDRKYALDRNVWRSNNTYPQYDDKGSNSLNYVIVPPNAVGEDYHVFKCLNNNQGGLSTQRPTYNIDTYLENLILTDGYIWKYMYSISDVDMRRYGTYEKMPIMPSPEVAAVAVDGIDVIEIVSETNSGYVEVTTTVAALGGFVGGNYRVYLDTNTLSNIRGFYIGQCAYITAMNGVSAHIYTIAGSGDETNGYYIDLLDYNASQFTLDRGFAVSIAPRIEIVGDGSGAVAKPIIQNGTITRIQMLESGSGYTSASARVVRPLFDFDPSNPNANNREALIRPIIPPTGGHGSNIPVELNTKAVILSVQYTNVDNIPDVNAYASVGLVRQPTFTSTKPASFDNRIRLEVTSTDEIETNDVMTQTNGFSALVHEIDRTNNFLYLTDFYRRDDIASDNVAIKPNGAEILDATLPISNSRLNINIIDVTLPEYIQRSGEVLYVETFDAIERNAISGEQFKLVLEF